MGKFWDKDPRDQTLLEFLKAPSTPANYKQRMLNTPPPYQYHDTPLGEDLVEKMKISFKYGAGIGSILGIIDNQLYSNPKTVFQTVNRFAFFVVPMTSMFVTFTAITYTSANLRGKDGPLNAAIGGVVAGSLAGVWFKSGPMGFQAALFAALFGACQKYSHEIGHQVFGNYRHISTVYGDWRTPFHDWSAIPEGEKGWTTGKE